MRGGDRWIRALTDLCLWAYPARFRERHGRDLAELYRDLHRNSARPARWFGWPLIIVDMLANGLSMRLELRRERGRGRGSGRGGVFMANVASDLRYGIRILLRAPGFTVVAVLTVALGIGANTAIFSVVNGVLLRPLAYEEPEALVSVRSRFLPESGFDFADFDIDPVEYLDYRDTNETLSDFAAWYVTGITHAADGLEPERILAVVGTWNLLPTLGARPVLGRLFVPDDDLPDAPDRLVLSHGFWSRAYGSDPAVVGRSITINGRPFEVVGVLAEGFGFPQQRHQVFTTLNLSENPSGRQSHYLSGLGRLAPGVTMEQARADMDRLMARWEADHPRIHTGHFFTMQPLREARVGAARTPLLVLMGAVGFVLLVVCANMANLLLVRGQTQQRETAIRRAIGAGRWRLLQGALVQSVLLAAGGGALGLLLARLGLDALLALAGDNLPRAAEVSMDATVLGFAAALSLGTAVVFGLIPALQAAVGENLGAITEGGRSGTVRGRTLRARNALVTAEVALSIVLVVGAGLMMRSFSRLMADPTGFDPEYVLIASMSLNRAGYPDADGVVAFYDRLQERLEALPGVEAASATSNMPVYAGSPLNDFSLPGLPEPGEGEPAWNGAVSLVRPGYFETMGIALLRGRTIQASDGATAPPVAVISESLARQFIGDRDPIGMQMQYAGAPEDAVPWTIVGVVADVQIRGLGQEAGVGPAYYLAHKQIPVTQSGGWGRYMTLMVRTAGDPLALAPGVRAAVSELDGELPLTGVQAYTTAMADSVSQPRLVTTLMGVFALVALLLGAVGIYGVTAFAVAQRRHEIGIRLALGARREEVAALVLRRGMAPVLTGVVVGVGVALAGSRVMESLLFQVSRTDVPTYGTVVAILAAVGLAACWIPARRAMRLDPMTTLKSD